jgi:serine/threonine protein kinase
MNAAPLEPFDHARPLARCVGTPVPRALPASIGRYHLHDPIGTGGMATVHLAWSIDAARVVAIKRLRPDLAGRRDFVAMLADEARLTSRIEHRNVVRALDVVEAGDEPCLVLSYVRGASLSHLAQRAAARGERVPAGVAAAIAVGILRGLHAAHEATSPEGEPLAIVHRDVSPQNVMVDVSGITRVLDFGIAEAAGAVRPNRAGEVRGKIHYMAPEQLTYDGVVSRRTDVYAASVVLWELLSGCRLFKDELRGAASDGSAASKACVDALLRRYAEIPPPSAFASGIESALDAIVLCGLEPSPSKRFATAQEMADAIAACGVASAEYDVAEWVRSLEDREIAERARKVEAIEASGGTVCGESEESAVEAAPQSGRVARGWMF